MPKKHGERLVTVGRSQDATRTTKYSFDSFLADENARADGGALMDVMQDKEGRHG
jgi:hypothetical protein